MPVRRAAGFHWASRLNPAWGEPLYGKLIALLLMNSRRLADYMSGRGGYARSAEGRSIDSLAYAARIRNPLLQNRARPFASSRRWYYDATGMTLNLIEIRELGPAANAWLAKSLGDYPRATDPLSQGGEGQEGVVPSATTWP
jgi:hypothetical protein